jgi:hypothetical protein
MTLRAYIRRLHGLWSKADKLEIAKRRARLRSRIEAFNDMAPMFIRGSHRIEDLKDDMIAPDDEATDDEDDPFAPPDLESYVGEAELIALRLPSTMGRDICLKLKLNDIIDTEFSLRKGQANDALGGLRQSIGEKSFMYRENLRPAKGVTRAIPNHHGRPNIDNAQMCVCIGPQSINQACGRCCSYQCRVSAGHAGGPQGQLNNLQYQRTRLTSQQARLVLVNE